MPRFTAALMKQGIILILIGRARGSSAIRQAPIHLWSLPPSPPPIRSGWRWLNNAISNSVRRNAGHAPHNTNSRWHNGQNAKHFVLPPAKDCRRCRLSAARAIRCRGNASWMPGRQPSSSANGRTARQPLMQSQKLRGSLAFNSGLQFCCAQQPRALAAADEFAGKGHAGIIGRCRHSIHPPKPADLTV